MAPNRTTRTRRDRCPGVARPWPAEDGLLVRLRLCGGRMTPTALAALLDVAEAYGDGRVYVTGRANLQVRALPGGDRGLRADVLAALGATGLVPSASHDLVRNVMVSPQTGLAGGRTDLRPVAGALDAALCAEPRLAELPGRFLFVLDDGRGDLIRRPCDLGLVALDDEQAQLRVGDGWGPVVPLPEAATALAALALAFLDRRGAGPSAAWHVVELASPPAPAVPPDPRLPDPAAPLPFGDVPGGRHVAVPEGGLDRRTVDAFTATAADLVVTPWRGVLVAGEKR